MTATLLLWIGIAFIETALAGGVVLINKRLLTCLDPVATNMFVRAAALITIFVVTAPLTLLELWSLTYDMTWEAALYISILAIVGWLIAQNVYYFALRSGRVSVVIPITSTNLLFTALFATVLIGATLGRLTLIGLVIAAAGVAGIARAERRDVAVADGLSEEPLAQPVMTRAWRRRGPRGSLPLVVLLALISAAGWGLAPVLIQMAQQSVGGASVTMILQAQGMGLLMIIGVALARRVSLATRTLTSVERRRARRLVIVAGTIEGSCAILFYLIIEHLGSVQTALITATTPIFAIAWSAVFLHERLSRSLAIGVIVTLLGVFIATADRLH